MKKQRIHNTELDASRVALGLMRLAGKSTEEGAAIVQAALDNGINFFDHADVYGGGQSEIVFRNAVAHLGLKREDYILQSKCGIRKETPSFDFSYEHIIEAVDGILERLGTDYLDILLLHRPDILWEPKEINRAFTDLHAAGKVHHFGVSNMNVQQMAYLQEHLDFKIVANQLQLSIMHADLLSTGTYVNMRQNHEQVAAAGIVDYMRRKNITLQAWSPFQYGFFEGVFIDHPDFEALNVVLETIAKKYDVTKTSIAIAWINTHPGEFQTIIGTMTPQRIQESAWGGDIILTRTEWYEIYKAAGHVLP